jgi:hypothetical protein
MQTNIGMKFMTLSQTTDLDIHNLPIGTKIVVIDKDSTGLCHEEYTTNSLCYRGEYSLEGGYSVHADWFVLGYIVIKHEWNRIVYKDNFLINLNSLSKQIHRDNVKAGWWTDPESGEDLREGWWSKYVDFTKLALVHSEVSEAVEGARKGIADDHLPQRDMEEVELADTIIRILDYCGKKNYDIHGALFEKLEYNKNRYFSGDHSLQSRLSPYGKKV